MHHHKSPHKSPHKSHHNRFIQYPPGFMPIQPIAPHIMSPIMSPIISPIMSPTRFRSYPGFSSPYQTQNNLSELLYQSIFKKPRSIINLRDKLYSNIEYIGIIFISSGKILFIKDEMKIPYGMKNSYESFYEAAHRIFKEQTGFDIDDNDIINKSHYNRFQRTTNRIAKFYIINTTQSVTTDKIIYIENEKLSENRLHYSIHSLFRDLVDSNEFKSPDDIEIITSINQIFTGKNYSEILNLYKEFKRVGKINSEMPNVTYDDSNEKIKSAYNKLNISKPKT
jgi:hypothetical protein